MDNTKKLSSASKRVNGWILNGGQIRRSIRDEELSKLEDEIKKAYTVKTLHAQLAERQANQLAAKIQIKIVDEIAQNRANAEEEKRDLLEKSERLKRANELKIVLEQQINQNRKERDLLKKEEHMERMVLVEVDRIRDERELREKVRYKEQLAEQLCLESLIQSEIQEINKHKLEELEAVESFKNKIYLEKLAERAARIAKLQLYTLMKREAVIEAVVKVLFKFEGAKKERQRLLDDLAVEDVRFEAEVEAREAELRHRRKMHELAEDLKGQIQFENECKKRFLDREKEFAETVMAKVMESERMEQATMEMKRRHRVECRQELERLMKERECARAQELDRLHRTLEEERLMEQADREEAKKARMLLLERHIESVAEFMNRKTLYDEEQAIIDKSQQKK